MNGGPEGPQLHKASLVGPPQGGPYDGNRGGDYFRGGDAGGAAGAAAGAGGVAGGGSSVRQTACELFITVSVVPPQQYTVHLSGAL